MQVILRIVDENMRDPEVRIVEDCYGPSVVDIWLLARVALLSMRQGWVGTHTSCQKLTSELMAMPQVTRLASSCWL